MRPLSYAAVVWPISSTDASATLSAVRRVISNPSSSPRLSMLVLAVGVMLLLALVVLGLLAVTPARRRVVRVRRHYGERPVAPADAHPASDAAPAPALADLAGRGPRPPGRVFMALTSPIAMLALVVLGVGGLYVATSVDTYCGSTCHAGSESVMAAAERDHAPCVSCHESGYFAVLPNSAARTRMLWRYALGGAPGRVSAVVDSSACRRCHSRVERATITSSDGLRMSHTEVVRAGMPCSSCHAGAGHSGAGAVVGANTCLPCHDSRQASADCGTCHNADAQATRLSQVSSRERLGSGKWEYPAVRAAGSKCGACHDQEKECDGCHTIRMPHSEAFIKGGHAVTSAFERKLACWKCHDPQFCSNGDCHFAAFSPETGATTHGADWKQEHTRSAWNAGCVCHQGRTSRTDPICTLCHAEDRTLRAVVE